MSAEDIAFKELVHKQDRRISDRLLNVRTHINLGALTGQLIFLLLHFRQQIIDRRLKEGFHFVSMPVNVSHANFHASFCNSLGDSDHILILVV